MVLDQVCNSTISSEVDLQSRKSSYRTIEAENYSSNYGGSNSGTITKKKMKMNNERKGNHQDVWGPIFKNKEHFIDMHFC
ncbi:hypothetical protein SK128_014917 [Halocaridina rubra]|uniref:Uncharacterized protein n=1 Tax=Halocaridina rubra TaxID=373956 RepID=A0AAN8WMT9_HALRR